MPVALDCPRSPDPSDVEDDVDLLLADLDGTDPTAIETTRHTVRVFFANASARAAALDILRTARPGLPCTPVDLPDDDWAARSQASLRPVRVGRVVVTPPWHARDLASLTPPARPGEDGPPIVILIQPSMGFGTGHHESTRLCLDLLQITSVMGRRTLDVGTGSGVLGLAAWRLGADTVIAIEPDADALEAAAANLALNAADQAVDLLPLSLSSTGVWERGPFDLVLANLTGALLTREARSLRRLLAPGARLIASGLVADERDAVARAFTAQGLRSVAERSQGDWVGLCFERRASTSPKRATAS